MNARNQLPFYGIRELAAFLFCIFVSVISPAISVTVAQQTLLEGVKGDGADAVDRINQLLDDGQETQAVKELDLALKAEPNVVLYQLRGQVWAKVGKTERAKADYAEALKLESENALTYRLRAKLLMEIEPDLAEQDLERSLALSPDDPLTNLISGVFWARQKEPEKAAEYLRKAIEIDPSNPDPYFNLVEVLRRMGNLEEAIKVSDQSLETGQFVRNTFANRATVLKALDRKAEAIEAYTKAIEISPDDVQLHNLRGNLYFSLERPKLALADFQFCADAEPQKGMSWANLARANSELGNATMAIEMANRAVEVEPEYDYGWFVRGEVFRDAGEYRNAIRDFGMAAKLDPDWDAPLVELADCYSEIEEYQSSVDAYAKALAISPEYMYCHVNRAWTFLQMDQPKDALSACQAALAIDPNDREANVNAGDACRMLKKYEQAIQHYSIVIGSGSESEEDFVWRDRADCYQKLGMEEAAARDLAMANKISPPIASADKEVLAMIASAEADKFLALTAPELKPFLDSAILEKRLQMIAAAFPQIESAEAVSIDDHPKWAQQERSITLADESTEIVVKIGRDKNGKLLGVELRVDGEDSTAIGTMDLITNVDSIVKQTEVFMTFALKNEVNAAVDSMPKDTLIAADSASRFFRSISELVGSLKRYDFQDVILEMPSASDGETTITVYALAETNESLYAPLCVSFQVDGAKLVLSNISVGKSVNAEYLTQHTDEAKEFALAFASGDSEKLIALCHPKDRSSMHLDELSEVFQAHVCSKAGKLIEIDRQTLKTQVAASDGDFIATSNFVARFENTTIPIYARFSFGHLTNYRLSTDEAGIDWIGSDATKEKLKQIAEADLKLFLESDAAKALEMLNEYGGFDSVTQETVTDLQNQYRTVLGEIKSYTFSDAAYSEDEGQWRFLFEITGSDATRVGRVVYEVDNLSPTLRNIAVIANN